MYIAEETIVRNTSARLLHTNNYTNANVIYSKYNFERCPRNDADDVYVFGGTNERTRARISGADSCCCCCCCCCCSRDAYSSDFRAYFLKYARARFAMCTT